MRIFRPGIIYGFRVRHPRTDRVRWGYVGKTRRRLETRVAEHMESQPWSDTVVACPGTVAHVLWESPNVSGLGLALREWWFIRTRRPLYNHTHNLSNGRRIPKHEAAKQRARRERGHRPLPVGRLRLPTSEAVGIVILLGVALVVAVGLL